MKLEVLLPWRVLIEPVKVSRVVAETSEGSFGLLPHRLDCVAALVPGILIYETEADGEVFLAVDEGLLIKVGAKVQVSVRRAVAGKDLDSLRKKVEEDFMVRDESEQGLRSVMAGLETGFMRRLAQFQHE